MGRVHRQDLAGLRAGLADDVRNDRHEDRYGERDGSDDDRATPANPFADLLAEECAKAEEHPAAGRCRGGGGPEGPGLGVHAATSF